MMPATATKTKVRQQIDKDEQRAKDRMTDVAADVMFGMYPAWTVDTLLTHPVEAIKLCREVAKRLNQKFNAELAHRICRALLNARKHGDMRRGRAA
jgi:hypothetical protein